MGNAKLAFRLYLKCLDKISGLSSLQQRQEKSSHQRMSADTNVQPPVSIDSSSLDLYLWEN